MRIPEGVSELGSPEEMDRRGEKLGMSDVTGKVQTVLGAIEPKELGVTLTHEHLLMSGECYFVEPEEASKRALVDAPLTTDLLGIIRQVREHNLDNRQLWDVQTAIEEVSLYMQHGGRSLVEATPIGVGRDPVGLARISRATGLQVIMGAGYYVPLSHPEDMDLRTEDDIAAEMVQDIASGVGETRIRSGIIGEIGCVWPMVENVRKVLRAAVHAQSRTGAPILIHPGANPASPLEVVDIMVKAGADPTRMVMGHVDDRITDLGALKELAETGCYIEYDGFGTEDTAINLSITSRSYNPPSDDQRLDRIEFLVGEGYLNRIVIAQDVSNKYQYRRFGGKGYAHILNNIVPRMRRRGFSESQVQAILVDNPRDALTFR